MRMVGDRFETLRQDMVQVIALHAQHAGSQVGKENIHDQVLDVMGRVPRHSFLLSDLLPYAYLDGPLPIGFDKTISQPFIVALMTDLLDLKPGDRVLEIGTGLGYHAAILAELAEAVFTIEIIEELASQARKNLYRAGYSNIELKVGDGSKGWAEHAPFDKILVAAAPDLIPPALIYQLSPNGRMVVPAGNPETQQLMLVFKNEAGTVSTRDVLPVRFGALESYS
ncbi:MAG: protein-L-isoaspartate(D-aspartate) O-methyltransferase [Rhodospirillales bacterium]|jgi:protein-L-isoaspartate(D-aspartate) O-methyltransferase|nr:protein-L-isoaspartate(D-aspartate) O-methyltransferase [Rhodospirillales bacterium]